MSSEKCKIKPRSSTDHRDSDDWVIRPSKQQPERYYYHNKQTGESRWTPPRDFSDRDEGDQNTQATSSDETPIDNKPASGNRRKLIRFRRPAPTDPESTVTTVRSAPKRKPSASTKDLFEVSTDDAARPKSKRLRQNQDGSTYGQPVQVASDQTPSSLVSFSFKLPDQAKSEPLPLFDPNALAMPMDTSTSSMEDERMSPAPPPVDTSRTDQSDAVESMEVDEFVEEVKQLRKDTSLAVPDVVSGL